MRGVKTVLVFCCLVSVPAFGHPNPNGVTSGREGKDEIFIYKLSVTDAGKSATKQIKFFVSSSSGYGEVDGRRCCAWDSVHDQALIPTYATFIPFGPEGGGKPAPLTPTPTVVSHIPDVGSIICDQLLLEVQLSSASGVSANMVRESLRGSWRKAGNEFDLPPFTRELVIDTVHPATSRFSPFNLLVLGEQSHPGKHFATIKLVSSKVGGSWNKWTSTKRETSEYRYSEVMMYTLGQLAGKLVNFKQP